MKVSTPKSRQDLHIKRRDRVLEVGPGNRPSFRANVLVEKFLGDDTHRCGGLRIFPHQQLVNAEEMGSRNGLHTLSSPRTRDGTGAHAPRRSPRHRRQTAPVTGTPSPLAGRIQSPPSRRIQITRECKNPSAQVIPGHITILTTKNIRQFRMFFVYLYVQSQIPKPMRN